MVKPSRLASEYVWAHTSHRPPHAPSAWSVAGSPNLAIGRSRPVFRLSAATPANRRVQADTYAVAPTAVPSEAVRLAGGRARQNAPTGAAPGRALAGGRTVTDWPGPEHPAIAVMLAINRAAFAAAARRGPDGITSPACLPDVAACPEYHG